MLTPDLGSSYATDNVVLYYTGAALVQCYIITPLRYFTLTRTIMLSHLLGLGPTILHRVRVALIILIPDKMVREMI